MKLSTLTLSVLSAILLSACGGSSSNDNAPVDKGQPSEMKPTNKTPVEENTNQEAQKPSSTEKKTTNNTDDAGDTPIVKNPPKNTPIVIQPTLTEKKDALKKENEALAKEIAKKVSKKDELQESIKRMDEKKQKLEDRAHELRLQLKTEGLKQDVKDLIKKQAESLEKQAKELGEKSESDTLEQLSIESEQTRDEAKQADNNVQILTLEGKDTVGAKKSATLAKFDADIKEKLLEIIKITGTDDPNAIDKEVENLETKVKGALEEVRKAKDNAAEKAKKEAEYGALNKKLVAAKEKQKELQDLGAAVSKLESDAEQANEAAKVNGVRFADTSATPNSTFGEIQSATYVDASKSWQITFTDASGEKAIETKYDEKAQHLEKKENKTYGTFETLKDKMLATKVLDNSAFGYVGDKFYSVGFLASQVSREDLNQLKTAKYSGTAFVTVTDKNNKPSKQVADFNATAVFDNGQTFNGSFANFKPYADGKSFESLKSDTKATNMQAVEFKSTINKDNYSFHSAPDAETQVSGFFYGENAAEVGGLVKSDKLHLQGAFGGKSTSK